MSEIIGSVLVLGMILYLVSLLYVGPTYFRILDRLISHLKADHPDMFSQMGGPSLSLLDSNIRSTSRLVAFVLRKGYKSLNDRAAEELGEAARWRLIYCLAGMLFPIGMIVIAKIG